MNTDLELTLYPELLRRLAAGERLVSDSASAEKLAATALVVEQMEAKLAEAPVEKTAIVGEIAFGLGSMMPITTGMLVGAGIKEPVKRMIMKMRGEAAVPEQASELLKSFRSILEARKAEAAAKSKAIAAGLLGAAGGAAAIKLLEKKEDAGAAKAAAAEPVAEKAADLSLVHASAGPAKSEATKAAAPGARALLERVMKNFVS